MAARYNGNRKTTVGKDWKGDEVRRTPASIRAQVDAFRASGKAWKFLHEFGNCEEYPGRLPPGYEDKEVLFIAPPDVLHTVQLGPPNDIMNSMFSVNSEFMARFYLSCGISERSTMYGGNLTGKDVRKVWKEENVVKLLEFPDGNGAIVVDFLRSLREVHNVAARKVLPSEQVRVKVITDFRAALKAVVEAKIIAETPKCHIIAEEFLRYWATGMSLAPANTQGHEATHSRFRQSEEAHGTRVRVNTGTEKHMETLLRSVVNYSSQNANLLPDFDAVAPETEAEVTFKSVVELEASPEPDLSDPVPLPVFSDGAAGGEDEPLLRFTEVNSLRDEIMTSDIGEIQSVDLSQYNASPGNPVKLSDVPECQSGPGGSAGGEEVTLSHEQTEDTVESLRRQLAVETAARDKIIEVLVFILCSFVKFLFEHFRPKMLKS